MLKPTDSAIFSDTLFVDMLLNSMLANTHCSALKEGSQAACHVS